jgi:RNA polymerase sigma-70 factor (ECF subfamily)
LSITAPDTPTRDDLLVLLPRLRRFARLLTADLNGADELVLETLSRAPGGQPPPAPWSQRRHWLFAVMHSLHKERLAREPVTRPEEALAGDDILARFSRLPAEQRGVLALVVLEGLLYTEIADVLDVPVATVMSRLCSARERMRSMTAGSEAPRPASK